MRGVTRGKVCRGNGSSCKGKGEGRRKAKREWEAEREQKGHSLLLLHNKSPQNLTPSNNICLILCVSGRNPRAEDSRRSGSGSLVRLLSSEGLTRAAGSTSKMAHSRGSWLEGSVLHHVGLSKELLEGPPSMTAGFPSNKQPKTELGGCHNTFFMI